MFRSVEGDITTPYESLGTLEVKQMAPLVSPRGVLWTGVKLATLGFAKTPSRGDHYKSFLRSELSYLAKSRYGADKVINVTYWPDPQSFAFPHGLIYARGEMIRYSRFPPSAKQAGQADESAPSTFII